MDSISCAAARRNLAGAMDKLCSERLPVAIRRNRDRSVVMLSLEDYEALEETAYLLRSPANVKRLLDAIQALGTGEGITRAVDLDKQIRRGKAVLRELKATLEDLEDRRELAAAKKRNAGKPGTPLSEAAKELGL